MITEIDYINKVCNLERHKFQGTGLDGPFIGINGMLPSLLNKIELLAQTVLEYEKVINVYGRKHFVEEGILECNDNIELHALCDAVDLAYEVMGISNEEFN
jgi:hypothetical protein